MVKWDKNFVYIVVICIIISFSIIFILILQYFFQKKVKSLFYEIESLKTKEKKYSKIIETLSIQNQKDDMTGLYTRTAIQQFIEKKLTHQQHQKHAFIIIDIDDFKKINDNFGHAAGDEALISVSMNLKETFGEYAVVGRIGGDEFVVFIENIGDEKKLRQKLNEISKKIKIYKDKIFLYEISLSAGIAVYPYYGKNFETLYQHADTALYDSKSTGKGKYTFYSKKQKYTIKE